jgi:transposase
MRREVTSVQMGLMRGTETMPAPRKYPLELRERAVAMYRAADPKPVIRQMARDLGVHPEALRNWIRQDQADQGERTDRLTTAEKEELAALRKENTELRRANEILRVASAFFARELCATRRDVDREVVKDHFRRAVVAA